MAGLKIPREISYRPCLVNGEKCIFHRWATEEQMILNIKPNIPAKHWKQINDVFRKELIIPPDATTETIANVLGIVESEDGEIRTVKPSSIRFLDSAGLFRDYDWGVN